MNPTHAWMGGGMWVWTVAGVLLVVLLIVLMNKLPSCPGNDRALMTRL